MVLRQLEFECCLASTCFDNAAAIWMRWLLSKQRANAQAKGLFQKLSKQKRLVVLLAFSHWRSTPLRGIPVSLRPSGFGRRNSAAAKTNPHLLADRLFQSPLGAGEISLSLVRRHPARFLG